MTNCACGCGEIVTRRWAPGHNSRVIPPSNKRGWSEDARGYRYVYVGKHPYATKGGYYEEHRVVVEKRLGRYLLPTEDVHHLNGVKNDNRDDNLELLTHAAHAKHHVQVADACVQCGGQHRARGLCASCYSKYQRRGAVMPLDASRGNQWSQRVDA